MGLWEMIFGIVVVSCLAGVLSNYLKIRAGRPGLSKDQHLQERVDKLEERIANLETILTGREFELQQKFQRLESSKRD